ncbi:MAG: bifunctional DNA-formamidopyrimidine glycosylase/DNA-(apurinic or apyrimidinic site) lyase [Pseudomonadota bacterium]
MPELPEIETICQALKPKILNLQILKVSKLTEYNLRKPIPPNIVQKIVNCKVIDIKRRAKYICIYLSNGLVILLHLGMSGKLLFKDNNYIYQKHDHLAIFFENNQQLVYNDPRRFGLITLLETKELDQSEFFKNLAVEPLGEDFSLNYFVSILSKKKQPIKLFIMDNMNLVGVGNIYASESLFLSKILPTRAASSLSLEEASLLREKIIEVLKLAIKQGGSSIKDYSSVGGENGYFQNFFKVYGREGKACEICKNPIAKIKQGGRASFFCHKCQK